jgi:PLP dependent protein
MSTLQERYTDLLAQLGDVSLVAVSKQASQDQIQELINLGHKDFGENRVDQLLERAQYFEKQDLRWHFIGNLQSNKLKTLMQVPSLFAIHSIDRLSILKKILALKPTAKIFLQIKTSPEDEKAGFLEGSELEEAMDLLKISPYKLEGLMTMAPIRSSDPINAAKRSFDQLSSLKMRLNPQLKLSMGMSSDYHLALDYGTNYVRIGSSLFQGND